MFDVDTGLVVLGLTKYMQVPVRGNSVPSVTVTLFPITLDEVGATPTCWSSAVVQNYTFN